MPSFKSDLNQEKILSKYLDNLYTEKGFNYERIFDLKRQYEGIDIIIQYNSDEYFVDEKAQLHYLNTDLPTFTFELSYIKDNDLKEGWLFNNHKLSQYYFLITGIFLKKGKSELLDSCDIEKLKVTSVNRKKLIDHLTSIGLEKSKLLEYDTKIREHNSYGRNIIPELSEQTQGVIYFTEHLVEKPINIQLKLKYLIDNKVAKKFHYV